MLAWPCSWCATANPEIPEPTMAIFMAAPLWAAMGIKKLRSVPKRIREGGRRSAPGGQSEPKGPKGFATLKLYAVVAHCAMDRVRLEPRSSRAHADIF